jgi:Protein of unknown function (DUF3168)
MDVRKLVFQALRHDSELATFVGERIYQRGSLVDGIPPTVETPYIVYHFSNEGVEGPTALRATNRTVQVWAHDTIGDYFRIDAILDRVKIVLEAEEHRETFMEIRFAEKSPDLWDDLLKHLVRYSRFQAVLTE